MKFKLFVTFCFFMLLMGTEALAQDNKYRDPFKPPFSKRKKVSGATDTVEKDIPQETLDVIIEGIIASDYLKQAIIDGVVYKEGDMLKNKDAKIVKINKGIVSIMYNGIMYEKSISKKYDQSVREKEEAK